jgi:hypothetical protein
VDPNKTLIDDNKEEVEPLFGGFVLATGTSRGPRAMPVRPSTEPQDVDIELYCTERTSQMIDTRD